MNTQTVDLVDKIIQFLNTTNPPDCSCDVSLLKVHFKELEDTQVFRSVSGVLFAENLCCTKGDFDSAYQLTSHGKKILQNHGSFKNYISFLKKREDDEKFLLENSKESVLLARQSLRWGKRNTLWVIIGAVIATAACVCSILALKH